jgi:hypothetical protein
MTTHYLPMIYDDKGEPSHPNWDMEGERTPFEAATCEWEARDKLTSTGSLLVAKVEDTSDVPPESEWESIRNNSEGEWNPGDSYRKWIGCVEVLLVARDVPIPV